MLKLKYILNDLVDYAYKGDPRLPAYKRFYVEYLKKKLKTKNGDYRAKDHRLRIFTEGREDIAIIKTSLHEMAHHILYTQRGILRHDASFYAVYKTLLYAALDMGIFDKEAYSRCMKDSSDANKVMKMLKDYKPKSTGYKEGIRRICVRNAFEIRGQLKKRGYIYNQYDKSWEKEVKSEDVKKEKDILLELGAEYTINDALQLTFS